MTVRFVDRANLLLRAFLIVFGLALSVLYFVDNGTFYKLHSYLATVALAFGPAILRYFGIKLSVEFELACYLFAIPAMVLGIDLDLYKVIYPLDKIVHLFSGVLSVFGARELLGNARHSLKPTWLEYNFCFCFTATVAVLWECFEFTYDQLCHGQMQQLITVGLGDTMWDMIFAMIGGGVTLITIYSYRLSQKSSH